MLTALSDITNLKIDQLVLLVQPADHVKGANLIIFQAVQMFIKDINHLQWEKALLHL